MDRKRITSYGFFHSFGLAYAKDTLVFTKDYGYEKIIIRRFVILFFDFGWVDRIKLVKGIDY